MSKKTESEKSKIKYLLERAGKKDIEFRTVLREFRVVRKDDGSLPKIEGYAAVFNKDSEDMGFIERIAPGAFKNALKISDARALFNHDPNIVLGRQSAGTLELKEDKKGLWMVIDPPDTQLVRDMVLSPIERRDVREQSFGFTIKGDEWKGLDTDKPVRTITDVREIYDTSPVTFAAYNDTSVALRSLDAAKESTKEKPKFRDITEDDLKISITISNETFDFTGDKRFDDAAEKINSLRSDTKPTLPEPDNPDPDPTIIKDQEAKDGTLDKINELIERLRK